MYYIQIRFYALFQPYGSLRCRRQSIFRKFANNLTCGRTLRSGTLPPPFHPIGQHLHTHLHIQVMLACMLASAASASESVQIAHHQIPASYVYGWLVGVCVCSPGTPLAYCIDKESCAGYKTRTQAHTHTQTHTRAQTHHM